MGNLRMSSAPVSQDAEIDDWAELCRRHNKIRELGTEFETEDLPGMFRVRDEVYSAVMDENIKRLEAIIDYCDAGLNEENYYKVMHTFLQVEQAHEAIRLRKFDMFEQTLQFETAITEWYGREIRKSCFAIKVEALASGDLYLMPADIVMLHDPKTDTYKHGTIEKIHSNTVLVPIDANEQTRAFLDKPLNISFISKGVIDRWKEQTLAEAGNDSTIKRRILGSIQESFAKFENPKISSKLKSDDADNGLSKLNEFQQKAVKGILAAECRPSPYILFGPPGTGKTHTLVEAITQIYLRDCRAKILVCANSNICVDDLKEKLERVASIKSSDIKRMTKGGSVKDKIIGMRFARIHLATNMLALKLKRSFKYDYVFVDDAGHSHEPECLLPICSLKDDGCLVLAGDPKQLGPVVRCMQVEKVGLGESLLERMFELDVYKKHVDTNEYDDKYITKLLLCYRSDPRVMAISNKLFYDNELKCLNETPESLLEIVNEGKPLQFYHCDGQESQQKDPNSWRNVKEADCCVDLIIELCTAGLKPEQIGVIAPYRSQVDLIEATLARRKPTDYNDSKIASVGEFQGRERQIIIISSMRSAPDRISFKNEQRRFNVALSRAKWLVIVVGHKDDLMRCENWREFMSQAALNNSEQRPLLNPERRVISVSDRVEVNNLAELVEAIEID